jgi:hypothetical protein
VANISLAACIVGIVAAWHRSGFWMLWRRLTTAALLIFSAASFVGQRALGAQDVRIGEVRVVARSTPDHPLYEPYVAIHPANPRRLVVAAIVSGPARGTFNERMRQQSCAAFVSDDTGRTWLRHDFATFTCFDPWVVIGRQGQTLVTMSASHSALPSNGPNGLVGFRSPDAGSTWEETPAGVSGDHDHPTLAIDQTAGPRAGWIYLLSHRPTRGDDGRSRWGVYVARSRDGGKTFDDAVYSIPNNLHNLSEMGGVLGDGTLVATFVDATYARDTGATQRPSVSFDRRRAWMVRSTDAGQTFSIPLFITDACGPPPGFRLSAFAVDVASGSFAGNLYFACRAAGGGPIVVTRSRDRGESWSAPVGIAVTRPDSSSEERIPAIAVDGTGGVLVAWIDAGRPARRCESRLYVAASINGGSSFSQPHIVSRSAACAEGTYVRSSTGGDYFGLVGQSDKGFRIVWSEMRDGVAHLLTTTVGVSAP